MKARYRRKEVIILPIKYDRLLSLLKEKGYTTYRIRQEKLIGQATLKKLQSGEGDIDTRTIKKLCQILDCQPGDIMEFVPDEQEADE